ncbi:MAG TPA: amino acid permease [Planctomycetota bacterium]|nr:amino acid permease [Planctomycetota bacterium]
MEPREENPSPGREEVAGGGLLRRLGLFDCTMIVMGTIIGAGVFNTPKAIAAQMGSLWGVVGIWVLGGFFAMCGALVFSELGSLFPRAGGQYVFLREGLGRFVAFLFGWLLLSAINSGAIAYVANVFVDHLEKLLAFTGHDPAWTPLQTRFVAMAGIVVLALINMRGVRLGATVQNVAMLTKIAGIATIIVLGALVTAGFLAPSAPPSTAEHAFGWGGVGASLLAVAFTYGGFQNVTAVAGEVRNPSRTIPLGIMIGVLLVIGLYVAMNASLIAILGVEGVAATKTPAAAAAGRVVAWGEPVVAGLVMISTLAITQALLFVTPRIYYAMALDGMFLKPAGYLHPRWRTPIVAIGLQASFGILHIFLGKTLDLMEMTEIVDASFFVLCGVALFVFRARGVGDASAYRCWGYPWIPICFILAALAAVASGVFAAKREAVEHAAWMVAAGIVLYFALRFVDRRRASSAR